MKIYNAGTIKINLKLDSFQHQSKQMRILSDTNQQLMHQNRQLCEEKTHLIGVSSYADDEKMRAQRSACEWQKFGRFCTSAMQRETSGFAEKVGACCFFMFITKSFKMLSLLFC